MNRWMIPLAVGLVGATTLAWAQAPPVASPPPTPAPPVDAVAPLPPPEPEVAEPSKPLKARIATNNSRRDALRKEVVDLEARIRAAKMAGNSAEVARLQKALAGPRTELSGLERADFAHLAAGHNIGIFVAGEDASPKVEVNLTNASPSEAFRRVLEASKAEYELDEKMPDEPKVSLKVANVRLGTALSLLSEATGVGVAREFADGKFRYRIGSSPQPLAEFPVLAEIPFVNQLFRVTPPSVSPPGILRIPPATTASTMQRIIVTEERSAFNCPHCKGQVTVLRKRQQPRCTKCSQMFQPDWEFCPRDGAKRPETAGEWKFCPLCGKAVKLERSDMTLPLFYTVPVNPTDPAVVEPEVEIYPNFALKQLYGVPVPPADAVVPVPANPAPPAAPSTPSSPPAPAQPPTPEDPATPTAPVPPAPADVPAPDAPVPAPKARPAS